MRKSHRHPNSFDVFLCRIEYIKISYFFPNSINECNEIDPNIRSSRSKDVLQCIVKISKTYLKENL